MIFCIIFSLLLVFSILAENVKINLVSAKNESFSNYFANFIFDGQSQKFLLKSSSQILNLDLGKEYHLIAVLDTFSTPAPDFYGQLDFIAQKEREADLIIFPIGYLQGSIMDNEGNLIPEAQLQFDCLSPLKADYPEKSDKTGFFVVPNIPAGKCTVFVSFSSSAVSQEFFIEQGQASNLELVLEKNIATTRLWLVFLLFFSGVSVVAAFVLWYLLRKNQPRTPETAEIKVSEPVEKEPEVPQLAKSTEAIIKTLSEKEKKVVYFLLENQNEASQAKVRRFTKIPRTSLSRVLQSLEQKKIIEIKKEGKVIDLKLSRFFLGQD